MLWEMRKVVRACLALVLLLFWVGDAAPQDGAKQGPGKVQLPLPAKSPPVSLGRPASPGSIRQAVVVDPWKINLADEKVLAAFVDSPTDRLIVSCFSHGETLYPTQSLLFQQTREHAGKPDLGVLLSRAHARGKQVFAAMDCLDWTGTDKAQERGLLDRNPDLAERTREGTFGSGPGRFASPFHPRVRRSLREVAGELGKQYPQLDGLVLRCCLPADVLLGFNPESCIAYRLIRGMDPGGLRLETSPDDPDVFKWTSWRDELATSLILELAAAFRTNVFSAKVAVVGKAHWRRTPWQQRNRLLQNWPRWVSFNGIDEVLFECDWDNADLGDDVASCHSLFSDSCRPVQSTLVVPLGADTLDQLRKGAFASLRSQPVTSLALVPEKASDLAALGQVRVPVDPKETPRLLPLGPRSPLQDDPRLQVLLTVNLAQPTVPDCLRVLTDATRLDLTVSPAIDEEGVAGSLSFYSTPAWLVMDHVAKEMASDGHWERAENGYHLLGHTKLRRPVRPSASSPARFTVPLGVMLGILAPLVAVRLWRTWRGRSRLRSAQPPP
jgi:hypothetical protein